MIQFPKLITVVLLFLISCGDDESRDIEEDEETSFVSFSLTRSTDIGVGVEENCFVLSGTVTLNEDRVFSYSDDCQEAEDEITEEDWSSLVDEVTSDEFLSALREECPIVPAYSSQTYTVSLSSEEELSSDFSCVQPDNLTTVADLVDQLITTYLPNVFSTWTNLR